MLGNNSGECMVEQTAHLMAWKQKRKRMKKEAGASFEAMPSDKRTFH
jgi:hypothetical protein